MQSNVWSKLSPSYLYQSELVGTRVGSLLMLGAGIIGVVFSWWVTSDCGEVHFALSLTPSGDRATTNVGVCDISTARLQLSYWIGIVVAVLFGLGLAASLLSWWRFGWRSRRQASYGVALGVASLPLLAAVLDIAENLTVISSARVVGSQLEIGSTAAQLAATFGTSKWILIEVSVLLLGLTLYGAVVFRDLKLWPVDGETAADLELIDGGVDPEAPDSSRPSGSAVCLSGGGIRAASFAWGALARLESSEHLGRMKSMYSVSGGGFTAASLTASKGFDDGHFTLPSTIDDSSEITTPYEFVQSRRDYLDNRRGGVGAALMRVLVFILVNLSVIFGGLVTLAVPMALLARSRYGAVQIRPADEDIPWGLIVPGGWVPVLWPLVAAGAAFVVSWFLKRGPRKKALLAMGVCIAVSVSVFVVTIAIPWLAVMLDHFFEVNWRSVLPAVLTWAIGVVLAVLRSRLPKMAIRLGGLVTGAAMLYGLTLVTHWVITEPIGTSGWPLLWLVAIGYLIVFDHTGVQWWSMHPLYRDRVASTFVLEKDDDGVISTQPVTEWVRWSGVSDRQPQHFVCAATHRHGKHVTGLQAISYRFSRDGVDMFVPRVGSDGAVTVDRFSQDAVWFDNAVGAPPPALGQLPQPVGWLGKLVDRVTRPTARSSVIAAGAMSGAAVNAAMGRHSKGSTDSLMAVLNLRLGVWLPNQRFETHDGKRFPKAGLRYLFHEVFGYYSVEDPFVQVSDGGHWENLGLVEALRDRHEVVVVVDASGGHVEPATSGPAGQGFNELYEATDLARIELHTEVRVEVDNLRPDPVTGRSKRNWAQGEVVYHTDPDHSWSTCDCPTGTLLYVKAVISDTTPEDVLAFANVDRVFPDYSTADQFLSDEQFTSLVRLGDSAMREALAESRVLDSDATPPS